MTENQLKIAIGSDHAGYIYKEKIEEFLTNKGHDVRDFGTHNDDPVDYPQMIRPVAEAISGKRCHLGIVLGGSGNGEAIVANKVPGIRCAVIWNPESARLARAHNNANMIAIGQRLVALDVVLESIEIWLETPFDGGRHSRRIRQIEPESQQPV